MDFYPATLPDQLSALAPISWDKENTLRAREHGFPTPAVLSADALLT